MWFFEAYSLRRSLSYGGGGPSGGSSSLKHVPEAQTFRLHQDNKHHSSLSHKNTTDTEPILKPQTLNVLNKAVPRSLRRFGIPEVSRGVFRFFWWLRVRV